MKPYRLATDHQEPGRFESSISNVEGIGSIEQAVELSTVPGAIPSSPSQSPFATAPSITLDSTRLDPHLVTLTNTDPHCVQQYNRLVVSLVARAGKRDGPKRLLITSAKHGEGRTSVLLNLAGALARANLRVLVIDSDLSRPSILRLLGAEVELGFPEGLGHGVPLDKMCVKVLPLNFGLLAVRSPIEMSLQVLGSSALRADLQSLESEYDFILFDSPPLLVSSDVQLLLSLVDKSLLVIRPGVTTPREMGRALAVFDKDDFLGVVLNRTASSTGE